MIDFSVLEIAGKRYRVLAGVLFSYTVYFGEVVFVGIAKMVPYWKTLVHVINGPSIVSLLLFFLINESPRWQIVSGRIESAKINLRRIAKDNKIYISNEELENIDEEKLKDKFDIKSYEIKENYMDAFKSKEITKRLFVACVGQFTSNFVYYGIMLNSVWLPGDKHLNFLLSSLMSFPGEIISLYLMNKIGRKTPLQAGFLTCGLLCIVSVLTPTGKCFIYFFKKTYSKVSQTLLWYFNLTEYLHKSANLLTLIVQIIMIIIVKYRVIHRI